YGGYATGSVVHVDAVQAGATGPLLAGTDVAFAGNSANSGGLGTAITNEMSQAVQPALPAKQTYGRGAGVELGLGTTIPNNPDANQLILSGLAEKSNGTPPPGPVDKAVGPVAGDPLVFASLLRGQADAHFSQNTCVLGQPLSFGMGYAADAQLVDAAKPNPDGSFTQPLAAVDAGSPTDRSVVSSRSFTYLAPNSDGTFGVVSEVHETIAPVTLFKGTPNELTIEAAGEWVLRARTTGKAGGSTIEYAPGGSVTPTTPLLRILQGTKVTNILTTQQLFGGAGLNIPIPGVADITIGEGPRAIAAPGVLPDPKKKPTTSPDGTLASAAVDVVRVQIAPNANTKGGPHLADVRIGHLETKSMTPAGGITCPIPVSKTADPQRVTAGHDFTFIISVPPNASALSDLACDLTNLKATDTVSVLSGTNVKFVLTGASDGGVVQPDGKTVVWSNLGSYHPGDPPRTFSISVHVPADSGAGELHDVANVTATLAKCTGGAAGQASAIVAGLGSATALAGSVTYNGPTISAVGKELAKSAELPRTGGDPNQFTLALVLIGLGMAAGGAKWALSARAPHRSR
ncbi:MAG: hypothetical protein ACYDAD_04610, partial [Acidimicrobiales bacterium]